MPKLQDQRPGKKINGFNLGIVHGVGLRYAINATGKLQKNSSWTPEDEIKSSDAKQSAFMSPLGTQTIQDRSRFFQTRGQ